MTPTGPDTVRLLGRPRLERAGSALPPPRGRKAWAVLAPLLLSPAPASRRQLTELLFTEADDPLTLSWTTPVEVDVDRLGGAATWTPHLAGDLLEGLACPDSPGFETWLLVERRRLAGAADALLRETAVAALASGRAREAVSLAELLARRQPYDEATQALLARALAATGDAVAAREHVVATAARFRRELGHPPSPALAAAAQITAGRPLPRPSVGGAGVRALLEAGRAATGAGAVDAGVDCLRRATEDAERLGDPALAAAAALALGSVALHAAVREAERAGDRALAATACRELGFVDVQAGRRERAAHWLDRATALADGDDRELSAVLGVRGMDLSDQGSTAEALEALGESVDRARAVGQRRQAGWSLSIAGRAHLLRGEDDAAARALSESLALVREERWMAFLPWPQVLQAELDLARGRLDDAAATLDSSFQLACQVEDPCWEGMAALGLGVLAIRTGRRDAAVTWLQDAHRRCTRWPDRYVWVQAHVLDALCAAGLPGAPAAAARLMDLAGRTGMRGFVVRASEHAARTATEKPVDRAAGRA